MPIYQENYVAPVWVNGRAPTVGETELRAASKTLQASQVLTGSGAPTPQTAGGPGQLYADTETSPWTLYRCYGVFGGVYRWWPYDDPGGSFARDYDAGSTYDAGAYCIHDSKLYRCISDIASPEAWTEAHWTQVKAAPEVRAHTGNRSNPHKVTAAQIGLGNLTNERQYSRINPPLKLGTMALSGAWSGSGGVYSQPVTVTGAEVTPNSHVEAQFSPLQLAALLDAGVGNITIANNMGALTAAAFGGPPNSSMTAQCTVREEKRMLPYLEFAGEGAFTLGTATQAKTWNGTLEYSTDEISWNTWDGTTAISSGADNRIYLRGTGNRYYNAAMLPDRDVFTLSGADVQCFGSVEMLLDYQTALSGQHPAMDQDALMGLFANCTTLVKGPDLPAVSLADQCYRRMFYGCTSLETAPKLPADSVESGSYNSMFWGCSSLVYPPDLPARTLDIYCYYGMFYGCTSLERAPEIGADVFPDNSCNQMFYGCTSLASAAEITAEEVGLQAFQKMFYGCTSLTASPLRISPAASVGDYGCESMFRGCSALLSPGSLGATSLGEYCYQNMYYGCRSLMNAPSLPADTIPLYGYQFMFRDCQSLTVPPQLPAEAIASFCYQGMFYGCTSLITAPALPASTLYESCYSSMFYGCSSLVSPPVLSATTLAYGCYQRMFYGCSSLAAVNALEATYLPGACYKEMYGYCSKIIISSEQRPDRALYKIPYTGTGTGVTGSRDNMFSNTGGPVVTPSLNADYYTPNQIV